MRNYIFQRPETGQVESVYKERWCWEAYYIDGSLLKQFDDSGFFHQFREIDQSKLLSFKMVNHESLPAFTLIFNPKTMKLIHFYRNIVLNVGTSEEKKIKIYCFGFEKKFFGRTQKSLMAIMPNDELIATDNLDNLEVS